MKTEKRYVIDCVEDGRPSLVFWWDEDGRMAVTIRRGDDADTLLFVSSADQRELERLLGEHRKERS